MGRGRGQGRAPCCEKVGLNRGVWAQAEDMKLTAYILKHGHGNWRSLPKQAGLARCGKSCRLRWINYLRPGLKRGNFTKDEEETIIRLHRQLGNKWSKIAACLPGRTDNEIKNLWNTHLKKRFKPKESKPSAEKFKEQPSSSPSVSCSNGSTEPPQKNNNFNMEYEQVSSVEMTGISVEPDQCLASNGIHLSINDCLSSYSLDELMDIPDIPDVQEIWSMVEDGCCLITPKVDQLVEGGVDHNSPTTIEEDSTRRVENKGWLGYLEKELDLWGAIDGNQRDAIEGLDPW